MQVIHVFALETISSYGNTVSPHQKGNSFYPQIIIINRYKMIYLNASVHMVTGEPTQITQIMSKHINEINK